MPDPYEPPGAPLAAAPARGPRSFSNGVTVGCAVSAVGMLVLVALFVAVWAVLQP